MQDFAQVSWSWQFCDTPRLVITLYAMLAEKWNNLCTAVRPCPRTPYARQSGLVHTHTLGIQCITVCLCTAFRPCSCTPYARESGLDNTLSGYPVYCCLSVHCSQALSMHTLCTAVRPRPHTFWFIQCIACRLRTAVRPPPHTIWLYSVLLFVSVRQSGLVHIHSDYTVP